MKLIKGMLIGTVVSVGVIMMCSDNMGANRRKIIRKSRNAIKKMGII